MDVWALGISIYATVFSQLPFKNLEAILKDPLAFPEDKTVSEDLIELLKALLGKDPAARPSIDEAIQKFKWL